MQVRKDKQPRKRSIKALLLGGIALLCFGAGAYILVLVLTPQVIMSPSIADWNEPVEHTPAQLTEQRLYIPRLKLNIPYKAGDATVLRDNAWHRFAERGDPEKGGNFILAGHRFEIGLTPGETRRRSPFYHINKVEVGDYVYADFNGRRYQYEVTRKYAVKPTQTEIEAPSESPIMTLYTCTLKGQSDGREVLEAKLVKKNVDPSDELTLQASQ